MSRPLVMGILNITPDSFSDGGRFAGRDAALRRAEQMLEGGADILDIGGESTRPGAAPVSLSEELARVMPVIEALQGGPIALSVDTYKPAVMRAALAAGVDMVNDIYAFRQPGAIEAVAAHTCGLCVMHMQKEPLTMQVAPAYQDVVKDVDYFLRERANALVLAGVQPDRIVLDPGFGFGKTTEHNLQLLRQLASLRAIGLPVLAGLSRKTVLGVSSGRPVDRRTAASVAAALIAVQHGANIVRVHDVAETVDALKIWQAIEQPGMTWEHR